MATDLLLSIDQNLRKSYISFPLFFFSQKFELYKKKPVNLWNTGNRTVPFKGSQQLIKKSLNLSRNFQSPNYNCSNCHNLLTGRLARFLSILFRNSSRIHAKFLLYSLMQQVGEIPPQQNPSKRQTFELSANLQNGTFFNFICYGNSSDGEFFNFIILFFFHVIEYHIVRENSRKPNKEGTFGITSRASKGTFFNFNCYGSFSDADFLNFIVIVLFMVVG